MTSVAILGRTHVADVAPENPIKDATIVAVVVGAVLLCVIPFILVVLWLRRRATRDHEANVEAGVETEARILEIKRVGTVSEMQNFKVKVEIQPSARLPSLITPLVAIVRVQLPHEALTEVQTGKTVPVRVVLPSNVELLVRGAIH